MSNMSYCRFENTASDLADCEKRMDEDLNESEKRARIRLIRTCIRISNDYGHEIAKLTQLTQNTHEQQLR